MLIFAGCPEIRLADLHLVEKNVSSILRHPAQRRIANRARLLVNLFEHEVLEAALLRQNRIPGDMLDLPLYRPAVKIREMHAIGGDHGHISVRQKENVARVMQDRGHIRRHEVFVVAQPDHRRRPVARRHNLVRIVGRNHRHRKNAGQLLHRLPHRVFQGNMAAVCRAHRILLHQMSNDFRIRLGGELVAFLDQLLFQAEIVLHNPVVHDHDLAGAVAVGMRIFFRRTAVRGPARVPNAVGAVQRLQADGFFQVAELALGAPQLQSLPVAGHCNSSGIVAAILQPPQALNDDWNYTLLTDVADNATHWETSKDFPGLSYSAREKRNSSMTGLVSTSRAIRSTSACACSRERPPSSVSSKYFPWRTLSKPL